MTTTPRKTYGNAKPSYGAKQAKAAEPAEPVSEKLQGFKERSRKEEERREFATQWHFILNFCFETEPDMDAFANQFGFGAPQALIWAEDIEPLMASIVDDPPKKRTPPRLPVVREEQMPELYQQLDVDSWGEAYSDEVAPKPIHQMWRDYFDNFTAILAAPRERLFDGELGVTDTGVFFTVVFGTEKERNEWMRKHRLGHYVMRISKSYIGPNLEGVAVTKLWSEA